jgi:hypothetical protein
MEEFYLTDPDNLRGCVNILESLRQDVSRINIIYPTIIPDRDVRCLGGLLADSSLIDDVDKNSEILISR